MAAAVDHVAVAADRQARLAAVLDAIAVAARAGAPCPSNAELLAATGQTHLSSAVASLDVSALAARGLIDLQHDGHAKVRRARLLPDGPWTDWSEKRTGRKKTVPACVTLSASPVKDAAALEAEERDIAARVGAVEQERAARVADLVRAEAQQSVARRTKARRLGGTLRAGDYADGAAADVAATSPAADLSLGQMLQMTALADRPASAMALLRAGWPDDLRRLERIAAATHERPLVIIARLIRAEFAALSMRLPDDKSEPPETTEDFAEDMGDA